MNAEGSRDPDPMVHCWFVPSGMNKADAELYFKNFVKPKPYTYEKFWYNHLTGQVRTL